MEIEVVSHKGLPETSIISIRAGKTRRQAPITELDRPLKFPSAPDENTHFKIDVLDLIGTTRQTYHAAQTEYRFNLECPTESEKLTDLEVAIALKTKQSEKGLHSETDPDDEKLDRKKESAAREYLERHGLTTFLQFLMQSLMKDKPTDPWGFLHKQITKKMVTQLSSSMGGANAHVPDDKEIDAMVARLYQKGSDAVLPENLAALERECAAVRNQAGAERAKMQGSASSAKAPDGESAQEPGSFQRLSGDPSATQSPYPGGGSAQLATFRDIETMQDEVSALATENAGLVAQLARMRASIDSVRGEVDVLSKPTT